MAMFTVLILLGIADILILVMVGRLFEYCDKLSRQLDQARSKKWFMDGHC